MTRTNKDPILEIFISEVEIRVFLKGVDGMYTGIDVPVTPLTATALWSIATRLIARGQGLPGFVLGSPELHHYWLTTVRPLELAYPHTRPIFVREIDARWELTSLMQNRQGNLVEFSRAVSANDREQFILVVFEMIQSSPGSH